MKKIYVILLFSLTLVGCNPSKVTDPNDPNFDPMEFRFEDYKNGIDLKKAIFIIFPKGTNREEIESILLYSAGYWSSEKRPFDPNNSGFSDGISLSKDWNYNNYFIDYALPPKLADEKKYYRVRILYSNKTDHIIDVVVDKYHPKISPIFSLSNLNNPISQQVKK